MKAVTFTAPYRIAVEEVPDPRIDEPTDVIVRVEMAGICGSDLHPYRGNEVGLDAGTILGHEFLGEVVATGSEVTQFAPGDRVVSAFSTSCGRCFYCRSSLTARCERGALFGWVQEGVGLHGGQAEYVRVPLADGTLLSIDGELGATAGELFAGDILSTGLFTAASGGVASGAVVAVVGAGPVGLMCVVAAAEAGAKEIWSIDPIPERRALAESFGANAAEPESAGKLLAEATQGRGADAVLEAVGTAEATATAYALVGLGGTIAAAGVHTEENFAFTPGDAYDRNLTYRAGRCSARVFAPTALEIARSGRYDLDGIVSHTLNLADAVAGYAMFDTRSDGCTKVLLIP